MSPNCLQNGPSPAVASPKFAPSLACIAEEEPKLAGFRRITVPASVTSPSEFHVQIPLFDINIYAPEPEPARRPLSSSYQRLLAEMDRYIKGEKQCAKYKEMTQKFTDRDWYWYSVQTGNYRDETIAENAKNYATVEKEKCEDTETCEDGFDLNADF
uniref:Uncharacterized protein n=1 Tax=Caenorhabditis japonica TaxID=281687 RepID=A0A8R1I455_CAEJA